MRRTKIVATVGPASQSPEILVQMIHAGVDVFRLNYSHGAHETHAKVVDAIREASKQAGREVGILQDLSGPKIRTGDIEGGGQLALEAGEMLLMPPTPGLTKPGVLTASIPGLAHELKNGHRVLLSDGRMELIVESVADDGARLRVVHGGLLAGRAGINLPTTLLSVPSLTAKDRDDLVHGLGQGVDMTALSFVREASDLDLPREAAREHKREIFLIAKIEKPEAIENLEAILEKADAVMVARGDLGVELPSEDVPILQKQIIREANARRIPVITATQMLESMQSSPVPTRAEASDVANAIFDGTDAVMLSGETAVGKFPVEAVKTMARIAKKADQPSPAERIFRARTPPGTLNPPEAVARAASRAAEEVGAKAIIVYTESGTTARLLASQRPAVPVLAMSPDITMVRRLRLSWGVYPRTMPRVRRLADMLELGETTLINAEQVAPGDRVVVVSGTRAANRGGTNMFKIHTVGEIERAGAHVDAQASIGSSR